MPAAWIRRNLIRIFRGLGIAILSAIAVVAGITLLLLMQPRLIVNESVLQFFSSLLAKEGPAITWSSVDIKAESVSFFIKRVSLDFTGLCVRESTLGGYNGCFDRARVTAAGGLVRFMPKITEAGPIALENGKALIDLDLLRRAEKMKPPEPPSKKKRKPFQIEQVVPAFIRHAKVHPILIDISRLEIREKERRIRGELHLTEKDSRIQLTGQANADAKEGRVWRKENYGLSLSLFNDVDFWAWNHWTARGNAHARLADRRTIDLALNVSPRFVSVSKPVKRRWGFRRAQEGEAVALTFSLEGNTVKAAQAISAAIDGSYVPGKLDAKLTGSAKNIIPEISRLSLSSCGLSIQRGAQTPSPEDSRYRMDCQVKGTIPIPPERLRFLEIPTEAGVRVQANLVSSDFFPSDTTQLEGNVDAVLTPVLTPLVQGRGELHGKVSGVTGEFVRNGQVDSQVAIELKIPDFQRLNQKLSKTEWGIPAPFQALDGDVTFRTAGSASLEHGIFPLRLQTRLKSTGQSMNLDAGGTLDVTDIRTEPYTQLNFALTLSDLKILLPDLRLEKPPRVLPDDRIRALGKVEEEKAKAKLQAKSEEEPSFGYRAVIRTPPGKPMQVVTNLAKAPIPINLDINLSSDTPPVGSVRIGTFPVEAFRRKATVQRFEIDLLPKAGDSPVDGRVDVPLGDYLTHIDLVGSIDKPKVRVTSDPPLGEDQLLAALLFNRAPEDLDPNESATLGSTRATISQGALSLASLFFLASTPIESLSYNPDTGQVTAQVRLNEGLSLNVGSGEKQSGAVGLRKRLGHNLFVTTNVNNIIQNSSTVSAYLEWRRRY